MSSLPDAERRLLLRVARRAIEQAGRSRENLAPANPTDEPIPGASHPPAGVFVTLHRGQRLRGCMGRLESRDPLAKTVAQVAVSAALHDPRFRPVESFELPDLEIEVSVLSPFELITADKIEVGRHGLVVERGAQRGLLLPQVATEYGWNRERFLEEVCEKAGLARGAWREPETRVFAFTAEVFSEAHSVGE